MANDDSQSGYLLDNQQREAGARFGSLAELLDPWTFRHVRELGIGPDWLAAEVGPSGHVLATDIDPSWLPAGAPYETRRHDVGLDDPPGLDFDLVHARLVLVHVPNRDRALESMIASTRPGGWLYVEDADPALQPLLCPDESGPEQQLANRLRRGFRTLLAGRGADLAYGRTLPGRLRAAGLIDVRADAFFPIASPDCTALELATIAQIRGQLVANGLASDAEIDQHVANVATGNLDLATAPLISAWGRKPALT
jgi:SAM-dependent methyltransferase